MASGSVSDLNLNWKKFRFSFREDCKVVKAGRFQQLWYFVEIPGNLIWGMSVSTDGDDLASQLPIPVQDFFRWVWVPETIFESGHIQLDPLTVSDKLPQDLVNDIFVFVITVIFVLFRSVTNHIVNVAVYIKFMKGSDVFQNGFKIFQISGSARVRPS